MLTLFPHRLFFAVMKRKRLSVREIADKLRQRKLEWVASEWERGDALRSAVVLNLNITTRKRPDGDGFLIIYL